MDYINIYIYISYLINPYGHGFMTIPFCGIPRSFLPRQVLDEDSDGAIDREEFRKGLRPRAVEIMGSVRLC